MKENLFFFVGPGHIVDDNGKILGNGGGHAWLIDGVVITKRQHQAGYDHYWSVNMGWGKRSRVYFLEQVMTCRIASDVVFPDDDNNNIAYYTQEMTMLYNITRK